LGNRVIGTKIRLTTEEKSSRENKKFNISNTAWQSHNQNLTTETQRHGGTEKSQRIITNDRPIHTNWFGKSMSKIRLRRKAENT